MLLFLHSFFSRFSLSCLLSFFRWIPFFSRFSFSFLIWLKKYQKEHPAPQKMKFWMKNQKASYLGGFWFLLVWSPTSPNFKTHKTFVLQSFLWPIYIPIPKLYTILLSSDLKTKKVYHPHPNNKKVSVLKNETLIKQKRVNQIDPTRETQAYSPLRGISVMINIRNMVSFVKYENMINCDMIKIL